MKIRIPTCRIDVSTPKYPDKVALISPDDYAWVSRHKWRVGVRDYVKRNFHVPGKGARSIPLHRLIARAADDQLVDHRNCDMLDCRRENLRVTNFAGNSMNRSPNKGFATKGVYRSDGRYRAAIKLNRQRFDLGGFDTEAEAARAYDLKAIEFFGEYAVLNFPAWKKTHIDYTTPRYWRSFVKNGRRDRI